MERKMRREMKTKKKYKINYLRIILFIIIAVAFVLGIIYAAKAINKEDVNIYLYEEENKESVNGIAGPNEPEEPEEYTLKISAGGDLLIHDTVFKSVKKSDGTYNFDPIFQDVKYIFEESDLSLINLEVPVAGNIYKPSNYPNFNSPVELLDGVKNMGIEIVSTANNHALDKGLKGLNETIKNANKKDIKVVGTYLTEDTKPLIMERNNIKIGIASYTYGTNGIPVPKSAPYCVNLIDKAAMKKDIEYMDEQNVDFKIFIMHFGQEYQTTPNSNQKSLTNFLVENGVDVIFGSHPHVPQPYEIKEVELEDGTKKEAYVIYSLGNFVSHQSDYYTKLGGIATVTLSKKGEEKKIVDNNVTPIYTYIKTVSGKKQFKVVPLEKAIKEYDEGKRTYTAAEYKKFKTMLKDTNYIYDKYSK